MQLGNRCAETQPAVVLFPSIGRGPSLQNQLPRKASANFSQAKLTGALGKTRSQTRRQVTSYDYGGLLDEAGEITEKYIECRKALDFLGAASLGCSRFSNSNRRKRRHHWRFKGFPVATSIVLPPCLTRVGIFSPKGGGHEIT